jgi:hypothetical protein
VDHLALICAGLFPESGPIKAPSSESGIFAKPVEIDPRSKSLDVRRPHLTIRAVFLRIGLLCIDLLSAGFLLERIWRKSYFASTFIAYKVSAPVDLGKLSVKPWFLFFPSCHPCEPIFTNPGNQTRLGATWSKSMTSSSSRITPANTPFPRSPWREFSPAPD